MSVEIFGSSNVHTDLVAFGRAIPPGAFGGFLLHWLRHLEYQFSVQSLYIIAYSDCIFRRLPVQQQFYVLSIQLMPSHIIMLTLIDNALASFFNRVVDDGRSFSLVVKPHHGYQTILSYLLDDIDQLGVRPRRFLVQGATLLNSIHVKAKCRKTSSFNVPNLNIEYSTNLRPSRLIMAPNMSFERLSPRFVK